MFYLNVAAWLLMFRMLCEFFRARTFSHLSRCNAFMYISNCVCLYVRVFFSPILLYVACVSQLTWTFNGWSWTCALCWNVSVFTYCIAQHVDIRWTHGNCNNISVPKRLRFDNVLPSRSKKWCIWLWMWFNAVRNWHNRNRASLLDFRMYFSKIFSFYSQAKLKKFNNSKKKPQKFITCCKCFQNDGIWNCILCMHNV